MTNGHPSMPAEIKNPDNSLTNSSNNDDEVIEIRLSDIVAFLKKSRLAILIGGLIGLLIGGIYAYSKDDEFTSQVTVLPEIQTKGAGSLGNLSSLAGLAGINLDNISSSTEAIRPDLYPNVLQSVPFSLALLQQPTYSREFDKPLSIGAYLEKLDKKGSWLQLPTFFGDADTDNRSLSHKKLPTNTLQMTRQQQALIEEIQKKITAAFDKKTGIITVSAIMPDPIVAATVANASLQYLTNYVMDYRTGKARRQVQFLQQQVSQAKRRYEQAEAMLSTYRDRNQGLYLNAAKLEEQKLQGDFLLAQSVYNDLSKQLEQAKIKVAEDTPVLKKSGPKRTLIVSGAIVFGFILGLIFSGVRNYGVLLGKIKA
jgi:uncharacterized protein involved in exopolysaccharide biosynthesis